MRVTVLGAGSSAGTPVIGCECEVCKTAHPANRRTRASCMVEVDGKVLVIDTGPDFRLQALRERMTSLDGVLYTHPHADHLNGIDDLRAFCFRQKRAIPVYGNHFTIENIRSRFDYTLLPPTEYWERPVLTAHPVFAPFDVAGVQVIPIPVMHGKWEILAYRVGKMAWLTDVSEIPASSFELLQDLDVLFLDCLRFKPHYTHFGLSQSIEVAEKIAAKQTYFIHMTHEIDVIRDGGLLPPSIAFAVDGLAVNLL